MSTTTTPTPDNVRDTLTVALVFQPARPDGVVLITRQAVYPLDAVTAGYVVEQREPDTTWRLVQTGPNEWRAAMVETGRSMTFPTLTGTYGDLLARISDRGLWSR